MRMGFDGIIPSVPRIVIDCRFAASRSGIGRYTRELTIELLKSPPAGCELALILHPGDGGWLDGLPSPAARLEVAAAHYSLAEHLRIPAALRELKADLLFCPHFNVPWHCPVPSVVTIHDLILHAYPNQAGPLKQAAYRLLMRRAVRSATSIIAVSRFVEGEIGRVYGQGVAAKTVHVGEGVNASFFPRSVQEQLAVRKRYGLDKPFFLYVGNAKQHKNVPLLLEAYRRLGRTERELVLVTSGREAQSLVLPPGVRFLPAVPDAELPALYSGADAFVTASLYEGFCLPVAEATACGCPVIATNRAAIPEVSPPEAVLLEPETAAFTEAMRAPPPRPRHAAPSWADAAAGTGDVLLAAIRKTAER
jgi:glycosyltransferase involved in cell wall biosynthesis